MLSILGGCLIGGACRAWLSEKFTSAALAKAVFNVKIKGSPF